MRDTYMFPEVPVVYYGCRDVELIILMTLKAVVHTIKWTHTWLPIYCKGR